MKITTVIGARPQFIKASAFSRALREHSNTIQESIIHTGQHYDQNMSDIFFDELDCPLPKINLGVGGGSHAEMTAEMLNKLDQCLSEDMPDYVLVYGDTNSTLAAALAASKLHIPIAHIEAGLRSGNINMPEEVNRIITDRLSNMLFCPTERSMDNLIKEGISSWQPTPLYKQVGDVMYDNALHFRALGKQPNNINIKRSFIVATVHRAENTDDENRLRIIFESLNSLGHEYDIVLPLHPRTAKLVNKMNIDCSNLLICPPQSYLNMVWLLNECTFVMTDSGGLQKEAFYFEKPCVTLRYETEWVELIDCGWNTLAPPKSVDALLKACNNINKKSLKKQNLYGTGKSCQEIILSLQSGLS